MAKQLQHLEFFNQDNLIDAFGFIGPDCIIRGAHIIPAFVYGATEALLGPSFVREWDRHQQTSYSIPVFQVCQTLPDFSHS